MPRFLPASVLVLATTATHAQQADSLVGALPDSFGLHRSMLIHDPSIKEVNPFPPFSTIQPALSRVAGVQYTPYSGAPGAWATVRIRGISNVTGSSQPLYVMDGVPVYNTDIVPERWSSSESFFNPNPYPVAATPHTPNANPLLDMPPEDVATVEVLKGAAATARYGMQGTNGVILISTRRGADGQTGPQPLRVRYAGWGGAQQVRQRYELLDARQYAGLANEAAAAFARPAPYSPADLGDLGSGDWQGRILRVAGAQSHNLSADGLIKKTRYYVAADYLRQAGVVEKSGLSRYHLRTNLEQQLTAKLRAELRASASQTDQRYAGTAFDAGPLLRSALLGIPTVPERTASGNPFPVDPRRELDFNRHAARTRRLLTQLSATYEFSSVLSLSVRGSREQAEARELAYSPYNVPDPVPPVVETGTATTSIRNWVADAALRYQQKVAGRHALAATLIYLRQQYERELQKREYNRGSQSDFQLWEKMRGINSPSANLTYAYAGRYEVQASLRSEFALGKAAAREEKQWFPGAQVSWHLHKEAWLAAAAGLSDLTLRAGVGQTGTYFSPDRTTHHDASLQLGMLNGKLTIEAGAYQRRTRRAQFVLILPGIGGQGPFYQYPNVTLLNRGLELTLTGRWQLGPLTVVSQLAAATNHNQVAEIRDGSSSGAGLVVFGLEQGQPVGRFRVSEQDGTYPAGSPRAGQVRFRDRNNDGQVDFNDSYNEGQGIPRYTLHLSQQLRRQRVLLDVQLAGLFGYQLLNSTLVQLDAPTGNTNASVRALGYWTPANQNTSVPRPGPYPSFPLSNQALASGSHLRLSQLSFSYEVLSTATRKASVWVGGQNLLVTGRYRGFDPNVSGGGAAPLQAGQDASVYPVARMWQLGVRGQF